MFKRGAKAREKLARTEIVAVRLNPKLRYLCELAARKQRRTLSSFIEAAVETNMGSVRLDPDLSLAEEADELWDADEAIRFVKLAIKHPDLLTHEEQSVWRIIETELWHDKRGSPTIPVKVLDRIRDCWGTITMDRF